VQSYSQDTYAKRGNVKEFWKHFLGNKKENDQTHMQGGHRELSPSFPYLTTIYMLLFQFLDTHPISSEFPPYFCYPNI